MFHLLLKSSALWFYSEAACLGVSFWLLNEWWWAGKGDWHSVWWDLIDELDNDFQEISWCSSGSSLGLPLWSFHPHFVIPACCIVKAVPPTPWILAPGQIWGWPFHKAFLPSTAACFLALLLFAVLDTHCCKSLHPTHSLSKQASSWIEFIMARSQSQGYLLLCPGAALNWFFWIFFQSAYFVDNVSPGLASTYKSFNPVSRTLVITSESCNYIAAFKHSWLFKFHLVGNIACSNLRWHQEIYIPTIILSSSPSVSSNVSQSIKAVASALEWRDFCNASSALCFWLHCKQLAILMYVLSTSNSHMFVQKDPGRGCTAKFWWGASIVAIPEL